MRRIWKMIKMLVGDAVRTWRAARKVDKLLMRQAGYR